MKKYKFLLLIVVALVLMACSFSVNVPEVNTGVTQTLEISIPLEDAMVNEISIEMGAGTLNITPGMVASLEGTVKYNVASWKPEIISQPGSVILRQDNTTNVGVPNGTIKNTWDLTLGTSPIALSLKTGAYEGDLSLGGLAIKSLSVTDGASKSKVRFDSPNLVDMDILSYHTGASEIELSGLANSRAEQITFEGGVGSYVLDFSGELTRDMDVDIHSGVSDLRLEFPSNAHVQVRVSGGLSNVDLSGTWSVNDTLYEFGSSGPLISVEVNMAVGNLRLIQN